MFSPRSTIAAVLLLYLGISATLLIRAVDRPTLFGVGLCSIAVTAPLILRTVARIPVYLLAAYAALVPFNDILVTNSGATLMKVVGILTIVSVLLSMIAGKHTARPSYIFVLVLSLMAFAGASVVWSMNPDLALRGYVQFLYFPAFFAVLCLYRVELREVLIILGGVVAGGVVAAGYAGFQYWHSALSPSERLFLGAGNHTDDPNVFASALLLPLSLTLMSFLRSRALTAKALWLGALLIVLYGFVANTSRGATISLGAMIAFLLWSSRYRRQVLAIAGIACVAVVSSPLMLRFASADVASGGMRVDIWKVAWIAFARNWVGGAGIGNFDEAFARYFLSTPHQQLYWYAASHSVIIRSAVELGVPGVLLVGGLWYLIYRDLAWIPVNHLHYDTCLALRTAIVGLFVAGFSLDLLMIKYLWLAFALVVLTRTALEDRASHAPAAVPREVTGGALGFEPG